MPIREKLSVALVILGAGFALSLFFRKSTPPADSQRPLSQANAPASHLAGDPAGKGDPAGNAAADWPPEQSGTSSKPPQRDAPRAHRYETRRIVAAPADARQPFPDSLPSRYETAVAGDHDRAAAAAGADRRSAEQGASKVAVNADSPTRQTDRASTNAATTAEIPRAQMRQHRVVDGDTLVRLAQRYLGDGHRYLEIHAANRDVLDSPDVLPIGAVLKIPSRQATSMSPESDRLPASPQHRPDLPGRAPAIPPPPLDERGSDTATRQPTRLPSYRTPAAPVSSSESLQRGSSAASPTDAANAPGQGNVQRQPVQQERTAPPRANPTRSTPANRPPDAPVGSDASEEQLIPVPQGRAA